MMDIVDQETSGWLNEGSLIEECADKMQWAAYDWSQENPLNMPEEIPYSILAKSVINTLRRRHLITEQGIQILQREGL